VRAIRAVCGAPAAVITWLVWAALAIGYLGTKAWPFDLFANFRVQYLGVFAVCAIALSIARWRKSALVAVLGVAFTTVTMAPYFPQQTLAAAPQSDSTFRLVTFNVWFRNGDRQRLVDFLRKSDADVVVLQEIAAHEVDEITALLPQFRYRTATPRVTRVLAILSRWPLEAEHLQLPGGITRMSRVSVDWQGTKLAVYGAHLRWPLTRKKAWARAAELRLLASRASAETGPVLIAGDFNLTPWSPYFDRFIEQSGLKDCALGQGWLATWPAQAPPLRIRIDHCFASHHWQVQRVRVGPRLGSDHLPVIVDLSFQGASG
jgi:endonuclease/exonuclease/phosphatase (EEP) superfamily protein YafD